MNFYKVWTWDFVLVGLVEARDAEHALQKAKRLKPTVHTPMVAPA